MFVSLFSDKEVKEHLAHYMSTARGLRPETDHLLQVCQLFVHCWEVSFELWIVIMFMYLSLWLPIFFFFFFFALLIFITSLIVSSLP